MRSITREFCAFLILSVEGLSGILCSLRDRRLACGGAICSGFSCSNVAPALPTDSLCRTFLSALCSYWLGQGWTSRSVWKSGLLYRPKTTGSKDTSVTAGTCWAWQHCTELHPTHPSIGDYFGSSDIPEKCKSTGTVILRKMNFVSIP